MADCRFRRGEVADGLHGEPSTTGEPSNTSPPARNVRRPHATIHIWSEQGPRGLRVSMQLADWQGEHREEVHGRGRNSVDRAACTDHGGPRLSGIGLTVSALRASQMWKAHATGRASGVRHQHPDLRVPLFIGAVRCKASAVPGSEKGSQDREDDCRGSPPLPLLRSWRPWDSSRLQGPLLPRLQG